MDWKKTTAKLGLDDEGDMYIHFTDGAEHAYLTFQGGKYHAIILSSPPQRVDGGDAKDAIFVLTGHRAE